MSRHKAVRNLTEDDYEDYYEDDEYGDDYGHSPSNDSYIYQRQPVAANITTKTSTKTPAKTTTTTSKPTTTNAAKPAAASKTTTTASTSKPTSTSTSKPTSTPTSKPASTSKPATSTSTSTSTSTKKQGLTQDDAYDHDYLDGGGGEYEDYGYDDEEYWEPEPEYDDYDPDASAKPKSLTSTKTTPAKTTTSKPSTTPVTKKTVTSTTTTTSTSASKNSATITSTSTSTKVTITPPETTPTKSLRTAEEIAETQAAIDAIRMAKMAVTDTSAITSTSTSTPHKYSAAADIFDTPIPSTSTSTTSSAVQTPRGLPHSSTTAELSSHLPLGPVISRSASAALGPKDMYSAATSAKLAKEKESLLESESSRDIKPLLNMVVIGHVDAGKSTLMGHLLYLQGRVSSKLMHKFEKESKEMGKASFVYAWVLDEQEDERARGVTVDVAVNYFETPTKRITLLDAPGHKDFIPNMISGAAQADAAVLVIPAVRGEFESGFMDDGQTKEHAILARSLGVSQLIVAINKLDTMDWSQQRYQEIQIVLLPFLKSAGFKEKDVTFVPVSGLTGVNILSNTEPALRAWYTGPTLLELIDAFQLPTRHVDKPFRMCIVDVFKSQSLGTTVCGKIESGALIPRDRVLIQPLNEIATIKALESRGEPLMIAKAGDNVEIGLKDITDATALLPGQFLSDPTHPIPLVHRFRGQIITMAYKVPLLEGTQVILFTQSTSEPATITRLNALLDKTKGDITKKNPRAIPRSSSAIIEITVKRPICVELFRSYRELGRFTLRRQGDTVGVGIITKLFRELS